MNSAGNGVLTVSQLNRYISFKFKEDFRLKSKFVSGEISNFTNHSKTGHFFFTLKDSESSIKAVMFREYVEKLKFSVENGMSVIVLASVDVFERDGVYQLYVKDIQPSGIGALYLAFEQLKQKLSDEGLCDDERKRPLPKYPREIGVITAKGGAALQDIVSILDRRYPMGKITVFPVTVQGAVASRSITDGIIAANRSNCDVLILARGGGSFEDLNCFNTEIVARAVAESSIPIITAVGHETDTTLVDYVSDMRAPTPSAAAEIVAPDKNNLLKMLQSSKEMLYNYTLKSILYAEGKLGGISKSFTALALDNKIKNSDRELELKRLKINGLAAEKLAAATALLESRVSAFEQLNPLAVLSRGYSVVYKNGTVISSTENLSENDEIRIKFGNGEAVAKIIKIEE